MNELVCDMAVSAWFNLHMKWFQSMCVANGMTWNAGDKEHSKAQDKIRKCVPQVALLGKASQKFARAVSFRAQY